LQALNVVYRRISFGVGVGGTRRRPVTDVRPALHVFNSIPSLRRCDRDVVDAHSVRRA